MKPRVFFKYINDVFKMSEKRDDSIVILSELCELLSEKYDINALEYIHMVLKLGLAEVATAHIKDEETLARMADIFDQGEKNITRQRNKEKLLRVDQLEKIVQNNAGIFLMVPPGGLRKRICYNCGEFSLTTKCLKQCRRCWRMYHHSCAGVCVCLKQKKNAQLPTTSNLPRIVAKVLGMKDTMTIADKIFLKQIFPCAKLAISKAAAINVNDKETSTDCISDSPIFDDCARALYNLKLEELDFKLKQHKFPLRCAKCFKQASCETNCCEFHVYCDDCCTDPATIAVTCLPKDILAKREIGRNREEQLKMIVKHWHKKNKESFIVDELTQTHLKEIFVSCFNEGLQFYRHNLEAKNVVKTETIHESVIDPDSSTIKTEKGDD
ncbi:unnamed protein product [Oikopleura dioica]|uniref:Uncharacterized protein n=1 Tax=Oikopleura dioica TaxID=34765 RepID=E4XBG2_OIKDI|nr:unnamed protein product [Oikopleura dioica]